MNYVKVIDDDNRLLLEFPYSLEAVELVKTIPGAKWCVEGRRWSIAVRYKKRLAEILGKMENIFAEQAEAKAAAIRAVDLDCQLNPLPTVEGFRITVARGQWVIVSPYDPHLVRRFKYIKGAVWTGSAWTFPAAAREALTKILLEEQAQRTSVKKTAFTGLDIDALLVGSGG